MAAIWNRFFGVADDTVARIMKTASMHSAKIFPQKGGSDL